MNLSVIGCGKMGFPLAVNAASKGWNVIGVDINPKTVEMINNGEMPIDEPGIEGILNDVVKRGLLRATLDLKEAVSIADVVIVIVPVLLDNYNRADLIGIKDVAQRLSKCMKKKVLISFETTLPVGTTRNILKPILESNGLKAEEDFYLIFSPERVKSLMVMERLNKTPKVVGGLGPLSLKKGIDFYKSIVDCVIDVGSLENAEMVKLMGMIYRDVNIALINEMARYCDELGLDILKIIQSANTDKETYLLEPGIGVGGHCTPVYPYFLINDAEQRGISQSLAKMARRINDDQSEYIINSLEGYFGELTNLNVLLLGLGFRPGVKEDINSPAYLVDRALKTRKVKVFLYDPFYTPNEIIQKGFGYSDIYSNDSMDAVILVTGHKPFLMLDWSRLKEKGVKAFVDGRNCFRKEDVEKEGIAYIRYKRWKR
ncbi:MAG: nucleotide sugar dehydrogenase [bacterium]